MRAATAIPPEWTVRKGRDAYLEENGFTLEEYTANSFTVPFYRWTLRLPNPQQRQLDVSRHDLHHVVTGYGTDAIGEIEISAWEVGAGLDVLWIAWAISFPAFLWGIVRYPTRTMRAFRKGRSCRSLFVDRTEYDTLLGLTVGELRARLGAEEFGVVEQPAGLNRRAPDSHTGAADY